MSQKHVLTALAIFAVTGAVSVPNSHAAAWRLDVSDRRVVDQGGLEWNSLIHPVADTGAPPTHDPEYQTLGHPEHGPIPFTSGQAGEYKSGPSSNNGRDGLTPSDTNVQKESSGASKSSSSGSGYGGIPTLPSADPMIEELSRAPR